MAGPWEQYQQQSAPADAGPWAKYQSSGVPAGRSLADQIPGYDRPVPAATAPIQQDVLQTLGQKIAGVIETPFAVGANLVTGVPVYLAGAGGPGFQQAVAREIQYQPRTQTARNALETLGRAAEATKLPPFMPAIAGANMLAESTRPALQAGVDTARGAVAARATRLAEEASAKDWARASKIEAAQAAQRLGVAVNPAEANPSVTTRMLVGTTGQSTVDTKIAKANLPKWNELARQDLGLPENTPLTPEAFEKARAAHSAPYDNIRKMGTLQDGGEIATELGALKLDPLSTSSPEKAAKVNAVVDRTIEQVSQGLTGENVVGQIRGFRKDATRTLQRADATPLDLDIAEAQLGIANALENLIEGNIKNPRALDEFRAARTAIAKTYDWERATGVTTKQVDPAAIAKLAEKGKPLTGTLADVANVAGNFPGAVASKPDYIKEAFQYLRRGGVGGTLGFALGGGPVGAAVGAGLTSLGGEAVANMLARRGVQNRLAVPQDRRIPLPVEPTTPAAPIPQNRAVVPYDYSQQTFTAPNFVMMPEQYGPRVGPAPTPEGILRGLPAPSAEGTLGALRAEDARRAGVSRALGQQAEMEQAAAEAAARRPTGGEVILDINPLTGVPEISKGLKGATPETFQNFGTSLASAASKATAGKAFDMTAAERVAWNKTKVDLAEIMPGMKALDDKAVAAKMMDRAWATEAVTKAREQAAAFEQIAARAKDAQARAKAIADRERMLDLADQMEESLRAPRPVSTGGQGPKTRAFQRNRLNPDQEVLNQLLGK